MDEITLTEAGWAWKIQNFTFLTFLAAQNSSHTQTFKYMSRVQFSSYFFLFLQMLVTMSYIRINKNWNYQKTANYDKTILNVDGSCRSWNVLNQLVCTFFYIDFRQRQIIFFYWAGPINQHLDRIFFYWTGPRREGQHRSSILTHQQG